MIIAAVTIPLVTRTAGTGTSGAQTTAMENVQVDIETLVAEAGISSVSARYSTVDRPPGLWRGRHSGRWFQRRPGGLYEDDVEHITYFYCRGADGAATQFVKSSAVCP